MTGLEHEKLETSATEQIKNAKKAFVIDQIKIHKKVGREVGKL